VRFAGNRRIRSADRQCAAAHHGIAGIDGQVDDDLLQLALVGFYHAEIAAVHHIQFDIFPDQAA
jgi:hypothetical protein